MTQRLALLVLLALLLATAATADVRFLTDTARSELTDGRRSLDLVTWELADGLLVLDRRGPGARALPGEPFAPRFDDAEWYLVDHTHPRHSGDTATPADFGHVHLTTPRAWLVEVPRDRLDAFLAAGFCLQYLDLSPVAAVPAPARRAAPAPTVVDPAVKQAYVDGLDQQAFNQLIREISGDTPLWFDGAAHTIRTRYYNTADNALAADYMAQKLVDYGYTVAFDEFTVNGNLCRNVVATRVGTVNPDEIVVVGGHYDSTSQQAGSTAPGAEDNGSGTSLVMEIARASAGRQFERTVKFVLFDAEEVGLRGSQHFVAESLASGDDIIAAITADMVAFWEDDYGVRIEGETEWEWLMTAMGQNVDAVTDIAYRKDYDSWGSDHVPFQQAGIAAFLAIDWDWDQYPYYHRTTDTWSNIAATAPLGLQITRAAAATLADVAGLVAMTTDAPAPATALVRLSAQPNPFNPLTTLAFSLDVPASGELIIHDLSGRKLATVARGDFLAGRHTVRWDGADQKGRAVPSGVYIARLSTTAGAASLTLNLVRRGRTASSALSPSGCRPPADSSLALGTAGH
ncbi:MAG: M28 family peptidase [Candidatus Krumholzibacteriia bacterium]